MNLHARITQALKDDAWEGHDEPLTSADLERIAKVAVDAADHDATRLLDRIKALIDEWQEAADAANHWSLTVSDPYSQERARQRQKTCTDHATALRALLDSKE